MGCSQSKKKGGSKVMPKTTSPQSIQATHQHITPPTIDPATIDQLLKLPKTLRDESTRLVETGNLDALGACWKSIKGLRGQSGMRALIAIQHFLMNSMPKHQTNTKVVIKAVQALLESAQILLGDESRVLIAAEVAKLATLLVMT
jgi:hypothetical protein